jgi:RNA polymerase sigma-70 factor (ECF subfamily)
MRRTAGGDRECFELIVRRHADGLLTFIVRMIGDYHRSEELFQDVFLAVWIKRHTYQHPKPFRPWLYRIALNYCRAAWRRAKLPITRVDDVRNIAAASTESAGFDAIRAEMDSIVTDAVRHLPEQQRTVVVLRIWNNMSYRDIAETVGVTETTIRSHTHHALASLRETLEPKVKPI